MGMARALFRSLPRPDFSDAEARMAYLKITSVRAQRKEICPIRTRVN